MALLRLYIPVTAADVTALIASGELPGPVRTAYGVSPALVAATPRADDEEREYAAFLDAVAAGAAAGDRVAVAALDLPDAEVDWPDTGHTVEVHRAVLRREIVAFHVGEEPGEDADLLWFDITEADLVAQHLTDS